MTTFDSLANDVLLTLYGYGLNQPRATFLGQPAGASDLTLYVRDASDFSQGIAEIGDELVFIDSVDTAGGTLTIAPDGRGYFNTTAAAHSVGARIECAPVWPRQRVRSAINDAIVGTYPDLFGVGTTSFTYNPVVTTYAIPTEAERVLRVSCDTIGPSGEQPEIRHYAFNSVGASGNILTLHDAPFPGRTVTVTYAKAPSALATGDDFTVSGLRETALPAIRYAACSTLLAYMDTARLAVDTAQADEYDPQKAGIGTATRLSAQLYQRYQLELSNERKRLLATTSTPIVMRKR